MSVICTYCNTGTELVTGARLYPRRREIAHRRFWVCWPCDAYVGTHDGTDAQPLGRIANKELRQAKIAAHVAFDPLWKNGKHRARMTRSAAYRWLGRQFGATGPTHIGDMDIEQCRRVVDLCVELKAGDVEK